MLRVSLLLSAAAQTVFASQVFGAFDSNPSDGRTVNPEPNEGRAAIRCCTNKYCRSKDLNNKCLGESASIEEAEAACARMDMRLCNNEELHSGMCKGTGCGYDRHPVWGTVAIPDGSCSSQSIPAPMKSSAAVRCCSTDGSTCTSLSPNSNTCLGEVSSYDEAEAICTSINMRTCTRSEVASDLCCGTGCGYNLKPVWSDEDKIKQKLFKKPSAPHLVFFLIDDMGYADVGFNGGKAPTPNIDRLAGEGVILTQSYADRVCGPSRSALLTGRYPVHTGAGPLNLNPKHPFGTPISEVFYPELLRDAGYRTHLLGKWHLGLCHEKYTPTFRGFDTFMGILLGAGKHYDHTRGFNGVEYHDLRNGSTTNEMASIVQSTEYSTELYTKEAERLIRNHAAEVTSDPFHLLLSYQAIHTPLEAPKKYIKSFKNKGHSPNREKLFGMISYLDHSIGRVEKALKDSNMFDSTVFMFISDNGGRLEKGSSNDKFRRGKGSFLEGGVRVVSFVKGTVNDLAPLPSGIRSDALIHVTDWMPTMVSLAKGSVAKAKALDGFNVWDALKGTAPSPRTSIVWNINGDGMTSPKLPTAFRFGDYKMITTSNTSSKKLEQFGEPVIRDGIKVFIFNIKTDERELNNLAADDALYEKMISFHSNFQPSVVPDLSDTFGNLKKRALGKANPSKSLSGEAWGPYNSNECIRIMEEGPHCSAYMKRKKWC
eukprot:TRINITY_DN295_c0_g1_i6.p1 TRINITY_DN295_c0_g1~~TRINITY_DN295_c0_g1_i6.p1  ORF type:complete len:711 (+),score=156.58 TRINITY_DN295_c0_g1_i6:68-2200(+)